MRGAILIAALVVQSAMAGAVPPGATPDDGKDDGKDDRAALQAWIDAACASPGRRLVLPRGDWRVARRQVSGPENAGSLQIRCDGLTITGAGPASRIVMAGSARLSAESPPSDWSAFSIMADDVTFDNFAIDGSQRFDTGEQTHLVQIDGPSRRTRLRRLFLNLPILTPPPGSVPCKAKSEAEKLTRRCVVPGRPADVLCENLKHKPHCSLEDGKFTLLGWFQGGDCIRSVGQPPNAPVDSVQVLDVRASACARSFIGLQRLSRRFTIIGNSTSIVGGQIVDLEPSGTSGIRNITIRGNRFARGASTPRVAAISLTGTGTDPSRAILVSDNFLDGGVLAANVVRVDIRNNQMVGHHAKDDAAIVDILRAARVRVTLNEIERTGTASPGPVVDINGTDIAIHKNILRQQTAGDVIRVARAQRVSIAGNTIFCGQPQGDHVTLRVGEQVTELEVRGNRTRGTCRSLPDQ